MIMHTKNEEKFDGLIFSQLFLKKHDSYSGNFFSSFTVKDPLLLNGKKIYMGLIPPFGWPSG